MKDESTHEKFLEILDASEPAKWIVAQWLQNKFKVHVTVNASSRSPTHSEEEHHRDCGDLQVAQRVEVKHRGFDFTSSDDFPYPTLLVCQCYKFDKVTPKPYMTVHLSKSGGTVAYIHSATRRHWTREWVTDSRWPSRPAEECYFVPKEHAQFFPVDPKEEETIP